MKAAIVHLTVPNLMVDQTSLDQAGVEIERKGAAEGAILGAFSCYK